MTKYYKGNLFNVKDNKELIEKFATVDGRLVINDKYPLLRLYNLTNEEINILDNYFGSNNYQNDDVNKIFLKIFKNRLINYDNNYDEIIYEIIEDNDGNLYGKELLTGNTFPIVSNISITNNKFVETTDLCYIKENERNPIVVKEIDRDRSDYFYDENNILYLRIEGFDNNYCLTKYKNKVSYKNKEMINNCKKTFITYYSFHLDSTFIFSNLERGEYYIDKKNIASTNEIEEYKKRYQNKFLNYGKRKEFINKLNLYASKNVFKGEIIPKKEENIKHIELDDTIKVMERIEYLLIKLKSYNYEQYQKYQSKYDELMNQNDEKLRLPINKSILESIEAGIEMCFYFDKNNGNNILEYLENKRNEYLNNLVNTNYKTPLSISDIDKIMELFLKIQDEYSIVNKRKIIKNITLLYLLELIENKEELNDNLTNNQYIMENLLTIIVWINDLKELEIIECVSLLDLSFNYSINDVIDIIKSIKVKNNSSDKVKKLV